MRTQPSPSCVLGVSLLFLMSAVAHADVLSLVERETADVSAPRDLVLSPDGAHLYVANDGDSVSSYSVGLDGALTAIDLETACPGGSSLDQARGIAISGDGKHVYVAARMEDALVFFSRETDTNSPNYGDLTCVGRVTDGLGGVDGLRHTSGVAVSPDGANVYGTGGGPDNSVAVFDRDAVTGALTFVANVSSGVGAANDVAVSPGGEHVYVVGGTGIALFSRAVNGTLTFVSAIADTGSIALGGAERLAISGDGAHVYVAAGADDAIGVFARDAGTGALTAVESEDAAGLGLDGASDVIVGADGSTAYATAAVSDSLTVYARSVETGALTLVASFFDSSSDGLDGARAVTVAADGKCAYVAAETESSIGVFCVDSGALDFGDAPDTYGTSLAANGPRHAVDGVVFLGAAVDGEDDGVPSAAADGDDLADGDDEDGVTFDSLPLVSGSSAGVTVESNDLGLLDAWVDVDGDGVFAADEIVFNGEPLLTGTNNLSFTVPTGASTGDSFARFRLREFPSAGPLEPTGPGGIGEVEDHAVSVTLGVFTLDVVHDGTGSGTVESGDAAIDCPGDCEEDYSDGTMVILTATADAGSVFVGWDDAGCPGTGTCTVTMDGDRTVTATFDAILHNVSVAVTGSGGVASDVAGIACPGDCDELYAENSAVVLTATPDPGHGFVGWTGDCSGNTLTCNLTIDGAKSVGAEFAPEADLSVVVSDSGTPPDDADPFTVTITVENLGPTAVVGAHVTSVFPTSNFLAGSLAWNCAPSGGATCDSASGGADLDETVDLPVGGQLVYTVDFVAPDPAFGHIVTSAAVAVPLGIVDTNTANDTDSEITGYLKIFFADHEVGDMTEWSTFTP